MIPYGTIMPTAFFSALWVAPMAYGAFVGGRGRGNTAYVPERHGAMAVGGAAYLAWRTRIGRW